MERNDRLGEQAPELLNRFLTSFAIDIEPTGYIIEDEHDFEGGAVAVRAEALRRPGQRRSWEVLRVGKEMVEVAAPEIVDGTGSSATFLLREVSTDRSLKRLDGTGEICVG